MRLKLRWLVYWLTFLSFSLLLAQPVQAQFCSLTDEDATHPELPYPQDYKCAEISERLPDTCSANRFRITKDIEVKVDQRELTEAQRTIECDALVDTEGTQLPILNVTREEDRLLNNAAMKWEYLLPWLVGEQKREPITSKVASCEGLTGELLLSCLNQIFTEQETKAGVVQKLTPQPELDQMRKDMIARVSSSQANKRVHNYVVCYYNGSPNNPSFVLEDAPVDEKISATHLRLTDFNGHFPPEANCGSFRSDPQEYLLCLQEYTNNYQAWKDSVYGQCWESIPLVSKERLFAEIELNEVPDTGDSALVPIHLPHIQGAMEAASHLQQLLTSKSRVKGAAIQNPTNIPACYQQLAAWNPGDFITSSGHQTTTNTGRYAQVDDLIEQEENPVYSNKYASRTSKTITPCTGCDQCGSQKDWNCTFYGTSCFCSPKIPTETVSLSTYAQVRLRTKGLFETFADKFLNEQDGWLRALYMQVGMEYPEEPPQIPGQGTLGYRCEGDGNYYADGDNEVVPTGYGFIYYNYLGSVQDLRQKLIRNRLPYTYQTGWETTLEKNMAGAWYPPFGSSSSSSSEPATPYTSSQQRFPGTSVEHAEYLDKELCLLDRDQYTGLCNPVNFESCWTDFRAWNLSEFLYYCNDHTDLCGDVWAGFVELKDWRETNCGDSMFCQDRAGLSDCNPPIGSFKYVTADKCDIDCQAYFSDVYPDKCHTGGDGIEPSVVCQSLE